MRIDYHTLFNFKSMLR